jgi:hypothetical protein
MKTMEGIQDAWLATLNEFYELEVERIIVEKAKRGDAVCLRRTGETSPLDYLDISDWNTRDTLIGRFIRTYYGMIAVLMKEKTKDTLSRARLMLLSQDISKLTADIEEKQKTIYYIHGLKKQEFSNALLKEL